MGKKKAENFDRRLERARRAAKRDPVVAQALRGWLRGYDHSTRPLPGMPDRVEYVRHNPPPVTRADAARQEERWAEETRRSSARVLASLERDRKKEAAWEKQMLRPGSRLRGRFEGRAPKAKEVHVTALALQAETAILMAKNGNARAAAAVLLATYHLENARRIVAGLDRISEPQYSDAVSAVLGKMVDTGKAVNPHPDVDPYALLQQSLGL